MKKTIVLGLFLLAVTILARPTFGASSLQDVVNQVEDLSGASADAQDLIDEVETISDAAFPATKQATLTAIDASQKAISEVNTFINASVNLTAEQKTQLTSCSNMALTNLNNYESTVDGSQNGQELATATKNYKNDIVANQEEIKACANTALVIGLKEVIDANELYLDYAKMGGEVLADAPCRSNTSVLTQLISQGKSFQTQLLSSYNTLFADGEVTASEQAQVAAAVKVAAQKALVDEQIYENLYGMVESCGSIY